MLTNSSSDDDEGGGDITKDAAEDDDRDMDNGRRAEMDKKSHSKIADAIISHTQSTNNHSINNNKKTQNDQILESPLSSSSMLSLLSPTKLSLLQSFQQQQQQLLQQFALSAIMPQVSQDPTNLNETKFRELAYKTMQDFLNVYGLSLPSNDLLNLMKSQQEMSKYTNISPVYQCWALNFHTGEIWGWNISLNQNVKRSKCELRSISLILRRERERKI